MNIYLTQQFKRINGDDILWDGPEIEAKSEDEAQMIAGNRYKVIGVLVRKAPKEQSFDILDFQPGKA